MLGSSLPVRFPECLARLGDARPFAVQPGQALMPETCGVALRLPGGDVGLWRPADRHAFRTGAPAGWLGGSGLWSPQGSLHLPYATPEVSCGMASMNLPAAPPPPVVLDPPAATVPRPVPLQQAPLAGR